MVKRKATPEQARAITSVWWEIDHCSVPTGYAHQIGPSIKRALIRLGYSGPLTITAIGTLDGVPGHVLRALSSTGIALDIVPRGRESILTAIKSWTFDNPPPSNLMLLSNDERYTDTLTRISSSGHNVLRTYPLWVLWGNLRADAMASVETIGQVLQEKCCEPGESALVCSVCKLNFTGQDFEAFTTHRWSKEHALQILSHLPGYARLFRAVAECHEKDEEMADEAGVEASLDSHRKNATTIMMSAATPEQAVAITSVWWDIDNCPVPSDCDAHQIAPTIKRALSSFGYSGPLTITAIGKLDAPPDHVLRAVSSTGIALKIIPSNSSSIFSTINMWTRRNPPPINLMIISEDENYTDKLSMRSSSGDNVLGTYPAGCLWGSLRADAMDSEKTKRHALQERSCEPGESALVCSVCNLNFSGQGFEAFTTHRWSKEHALKILSSLSGYGCLCRALTGCHEKAEEMADLAGAQATMEAFVYSLPKPTTRTQPKRMCKKRKA